MKRIFRGPGFHDFCFFLGGGEKLVISDGWHENVSINEDAEQETDSVECLLFHPLDTSREGRERANESSR